MDMVAVMDAWAKIVKDPKIAPVPVPTLIAGIMGNCVKCVALHRHFGGFPTAPAT